LAIDFRIVKNQAAAKLRSSDEGCLIYGLWLEGAKWQVIDETSGDRESITLQD
jgi:hypothetical protein